MLDNYTINLIKENKAAELRQLILQYKKNFEYNHETFDYNSALQLAVREGCADIVDCVLDFGANPNLSNFNMKEKNYHPDNYITLLAKAAKDGNARIVESLIRHGANIPKTLDDACEQIEDVKTYRRIVKRCMDYAMGCDFDAKYEAYYTGRSVEYGGLSFLRRKNLKLDGISFIGVSIAGKPVTRELLKQYTESDTTYAIITPFDLTALVDDDTRRNALEKRLHEMQAKRGVLSSDSGVVNLVPLTCAAEIGDVDAVKTRIRAGIDPTSNENASLLSLAAEHGHKEIFEIILAAYPKDAAIKAIASAVEVAKEKKQEKVVEFLQDYQDVNLQDDKGNTFLHKAGIARATKLLQKGANVNLENKKGETPLYAALKPTFDIGFVTSALLDQYNEEVNELVTLLLNHKADPNKYKDRSPLELAVHTGNVKVVEKLLPLTNKKELHKDPWYVDMMFSAVSKKEDIAILRLLKEHGADFNAKSKEGNTLLNSVVCSLPSYSDIQHTMRDLVRSGYHGSSLENTHQYFIEQAEKSFQTKLAMIDFLLSQSADPKIGNKDGCTPLAYLKDENFGPLEKAAQLIIDKLLQYGATIDCQDAKKAEVLDKPKVEPILVTAPEKNKPAKPNSLMASLNRLFRTAKDKKAPSNEAQNGKTIKIDHH